MRQIQNFGAALLLAVTLIVTGHIPAAAQSGSAAPQPAPEAATAPTMPAEKPDAVVLTFPLPNGQYIVSMVYSSKVDKATMESRARRLLQIGGWLGTNFEYEDKSPDGVAKDWELGRVPVMSSVTFLINNAPVNQTDGTIVLEAFLLALRELNTVHLTFATPPNFIYHGPKQFKNEAVEISCAPGQGSVSCMAKINDHTAEKLNLPLLGTEQTAGTNEAVKETAPRVPVVTVIFALLAALTAGIGVFLLARRIVR